MKFEQVLKETSYIELNEDIKDSKESNAAYKLWDNQPPTPNDGKIHLKPNTPDGIRFDKVAKKLRYLETQYKKAEASNDKKLKKELRNQYVAIVKKYGKYLVAGVGKENLKKALVRMGCGLFMAAALCNNIQDLSGSYNAVRTGNVKNQTIEMAGDFLKDREDDKKQLKTRKTSHTVAA
jgi:hypothetical protein